MIPVKPFDSYKWRWLSVTPSEGLLDPPVFLGVLRVMAKFEGQARSKPSIAAELKKVETETETSVDLVRTPSRNLIRNSGQYWFGTGLLVPSHGVIQLTELGRQIADGKITQGEFAAIMVQQVILPNPYTYKPVEIEKWKAAKLEIRPLALILEIINQLGKDLSYNEEAYLSPSELIKIVIPLAGQMTAPKEIANCIAMFRKGKLDISNWPNCVPGDNDHRFAREFLLFLSNFGLCERRGPRKNERYYLAQPLDVGSLIQTPGTSIFTNDQGGKAAIKAMRHSSLPSIIERQRVLSSVLERPGQAKFRKDILNAYQKKCLLTGEEISAVLEAAHIVPVKYHGADVVNNGICLRVDIHTLFDAGAIRIKPTGELLLSDTVSASQNYRYLPPKITIPGFVNPANVAWRHSYL